MKSFTKHLELISLVDNNCKHVEQLETLCKMFRQMRATEYDMEYPSEYGLTQEQIDNLYIIAKTTHNAHYDMRLFTNPIFQNPDNHVTKQLETLNAKPMPNYKAQPYPK